MQKKITMSQIRLSPVPILKNLINFSQSIFENQIIGLETLYSEFEKLLISEYQSLESQISVFSNCIQLFIKRVAFILKKDVKISQQFKEWLSLISRLSDLRDIKTKYMACVVIPLFNLLFEDNLPLWFTKELLKNCNIAIDGSDILWRNRAIQRKVDCLNVMISKMFECGDYEYQEIIMEIIFKMCSDDLLALMAPKWFEQSDQFLRTFSEINKNNLAIDIRNFLTTINIQHKSVISVRAHTLKIENFNITENNDDRTVVWIDVNRMFKTISICCYQSSGSSSQNSQQSQQFWTEVKLVVVSYSDIDRIVKYRCGIEDIGHQYKIMLNTPSSISASPLNEKPILTNVIKIIILQSTELEVFENYLSQTGFLKESSGNKTVKCSSSIDSNDLTNVTLSQSSTPGKTVYYGDSEGSRMSVENAPKLYLAERQIQRPLESTPEGDSEGSRRSVENAPKLYLAERQIQRPLESTPEGDSEGSRTSVENAPKLYLAERQIQRAVVSTPEGDSEGSQTSVENAPKLYLAERQIRRQSMSPAEGDTEFNQTSVEAAPKLYMAEKQIRRQLMSPAEGDTEFNQTTIVAAPKLYMAERQIRRQLMSPAEGDPEFIQTSVETAPKLYMAERQIRRQLMSPAEGDTEFNQTTVVAAPKLYMAERQIRRQLMSPAEGDPEFIQTSVETAPKLYMAERQIRRQLMSPAEGDTEFNQTTVVAAPKLYMAERQIRRQSMSPAEGDTEFNQTTVVAAPKLYMAERQIRRQSMSPAEGDTEFNQTSVEAAPKLYMAERQIRRQSMSPAEGDPEFIQTSVETAPKLYMAERQIRRQLMSPAEGDPEFIQTSVETAPKLYMAERQIRRQSMSPAEGDTEFNQTTVVAAPKLYMAERQIRRQSMSPAEGDTEFNQTTVVAAPKLYMAERQIRRQSMSPAEGDTEFNQTTVVAAPKLYMAERQIRRQSMSPAEGDTEFNQTTVVAAPKLYMAERQIWRQLMSPAEGDTEFNQTTVVAAPKLYMAERQIRRQSMSPAEGDTEFNQTTVVAAPKLYMAERQIRRQLMSPTEGDTEFNQTAVVAAPKLYMAERQIRRQSISIPKDDSEENQINTEVTPKLYMAERRILRQSMSAQKVESVVALELSTARRSAISENLKQVVRGNKDIEMDNSEDDLENAPLISRIVDEGDPEDKYRNSPFTKKGKETKQSVKVINTSMVLIQTAVNNAYKTDKLKVEKTESDQVQMITQSGNKKNNTKTEVKTKKEKETKSRCRKGASIKKSIKSITKKDSTDILNTSNVLSQKPLNIARKSVHSFGIKKGQKCTSQNEGKSDKKARKLKRLTQSSHVEKLKRCKNKENYNLRSNNKITCVESNGKENSHVEDLSLNIFKSPVIKQCTNNRKRRFIDVPNEVLTNSVVPELLISQTNQQEVQEDNQESGTRIINSELFNLSTSLLYKEDIFNDNSENIIQPLTVPKKGLENSEHKLTKMPNKFSSSELAVDDDNTELDTSFNKLNLTKTPEKTKAADILLLKEQRNSNGQKKQICHLDKNFSNSSEIVCINSCHPVEDIQNCNENGVEINNLLEDFGTSDKNDMSPDYQFSNNYSLTLFEDNMSNSSNNENVIRSIDDEVLSTVKTRVVIVSNFLVKPGNKEPHENIKRLMSEEIEQSDKGETENVPVPNKPTTVSDGDIISAEKDDLYLVNNTYTLQAKALKQSKNVNCSIQNLEETALILNTNDSIVTKNNVLAPKIVDLKKMKTENKHNQIPKINLKRKLYNINDISHLDEGVTKSKKDYSASSIIGCTKDNARDEIHELPNSLFSGEEKGDTREKLSDIGTKLVTKVSNKKNANSAKKPKKVNKKKDILKKHRGSAKVCKLLKTGSDLLSNRVELENPLYAFMQPNHENLSAPSDKSSQYSDYSFNTTSKHKRENVYKSQKRELVHADSELGKNVTKNNSRKRRVQLIESDSETLSESSVTSTNERRSLHIDFKPKDTYKKGKYASQLHSVRLMYEAYKECGLLSVGIVDKNNYKRTSVDNKYSWASLMPSMTNYLMPKKPKKKSKTVSLKQRRSRKINKKNA